MTAGQRTHFSDLLVELAPLVYLISAFQDLQNSIPCDPPCLHYVLVCKIPVYIAKMTLSSLLT